MAELTTYKQVLVCVLFLVVSSKTNANDAKLQVGSYFTRCRRSDSKFLDCVRENIEKLRSSFNAGIPDLHLNSLDPLNIPLLEVVDGSGSMALHITGTNISIEGLANFQLKDVEYKTANDKIQLKVLVFIPSLITSAHSEINGRLLLLPITQSGRTEANMTDIAIELTFNGETVERRGEKYHEINRTSAITSLKGFSIHIGGLYNGNKFLGDATNKFLNENWKEAYKVYRRQPEQAFANVFQEYVNQIFKTFPIKDLYLD